MDINTALDELEDKDAISIHADDTIDTTRFGRAVAMSFLSIDDGVIIKDSINDPKYLSFYYNKPFFKTNLKELRLLSEKIEEDNENASKKNKKIKNKLNNQPKDSSKKDKKGNKDKKERLEKDNKDSKKKNKTKKDNKNNKKNQKNKNKKEKSNKKEQLSEDKIKEKPIEVKEKEEKRDENSGIKFIVEEDIDEKPIPKKETKKESKTSMYIDNIADYFEGLNKSKDYKSSDDELSNKKNDYKSSKRDKSKDIKSDVIYNKKTNNKSKSKNKKNKNNNSAVVKQIKFKENIFSDIHEKMTKDEVNSNDLLKVQSIALDLELFENAYLAPVVHKQIISALKMNFSTRLFSESTLDIISSGEAISKIDKKFQDALLKIQIDFLRCDCYERPFCECLQRGISYYIVNQRLNGKDPIDISNSLLKEYQIQTYPGDIFSWLDSYVRNLDAIRRIARAFGQKEIVEVSEKLMKIVESGQ